MPLSRDARGKNRVSLRQISLSEFRCYRAARIEADARPVVLTGPNGAGKTNLLEAISFLVPGRGLRSARLADVGRRGADAAWAVAASVETPDGETAIGTGLAPDGGERRVVRIDGATARGQGALAEVLSAVWLTPDMDRLFSDAPAGRRRFLDRMVYGFDAAHAGRIARYERTLRERARLLRDGGDPAWLDALETQMAETAISITAARRAAVARLDAACAVGHAHFPAARLALDGALETWLAVGPALAAEDRMRDELAALRARDTETGGAGIGPHRSDLVVLYAETGQPAASCSTGEQKALLISIVLAHARLQRLERGAAPLVILDEATAHLDAARREALFDALCGLDAQAWLTGTDRALFAPLAERAQYFAVAAGRVRRDSGATVQ